MRKPDDAVHRFHCTLRCELNSINYIWKKSKSTAAATNTTARYRDLFFFWSIQIHLLLSLLLYAYPFLNRSIGQLGETNRNIDHYIKDWSFSINKNPFRGSHFSDDIDMSD